jgi:hypothetical protein
MSVELDPRTPIPVGSPLTPIWHDSDDDRRTVGAMVLSSKKERGEIETGLVPAEHGINASARKKSRC